VPSEYPKGSAEPQMVMIEPVINRNASPPGVSEHPVKPNTHWNPNFQLEETKMYVN